MITGYTFNCLRVIQLQTVCLNDLLSVTYTMTPLKTSGTVSYTSCIIQKSINILIIKILYPKHIL